MISNVVKAMSAVAAVIAVFGAGFALGKREADGAADAVAAVLVVLDAPAVRAVLPEDFRTSLDTARQAADEGNFKRAADAISSNIAEIEQAACKPSGQAFLAEAGALVKNCETGMTAVIAGINSNRTVTVTVGDKARAGAPGVSFADSLGRHPDCFLIYHTLEEPSAPLAARFSFDCRGEE